MGKKKRSRYVQEQKYNQHLQNKSQSNLNHSINKSNRRIEQYKFDYDNSIKEILNNFIIENGLDPEKIPSNSRIIVFELLKKNLQNKLEMYTKYINEHGNDENIKEYLDAKQVCLANLEQIDWIYNWTTPLKHSNYDLGEGYEALLISANKKLENYEQRTKRKFESLESVLDAISNTRKKTYKSDLLWYFYRFCKFIEHNDIDFYFVYISNTIKNLLIIDSEDPIVDFLLRDFEKEDVGNTTECESN